MQSIHVFCLFLLAACTAVAQPTVEKAPAPIAGPEQYEPQPFDVLHYDAELDLTAAPDKQMTGRCDITLRWVDDPATGPFYFHLRDLDISAAYYNGEAVTANASEDPESATYHYSIVPPSTAVKGDTAVIRIEYGGTMTDETGPGNWGGVSSRDGILYAMGVGFRNASVSATEHWLPCYDHPSDKATFHARFRVAEGMTAASNGRLVVEPGTDGTTVYDWTHDYPCATYLYTFAVGPYETLTFAEKPVPMYVYSLPQDTVATRKSFKLLPRMVDTYEELFTPYPFEKVGYVNTPDGSMEHQTMISIHVNVSRQGDSINSTGAHELSHQWFGDLVSPKDFRHAWLNESFATFCEALWAEELEGNIGYLEALQGYSFSYIRNISEYEGVLPLYDFPRESPSSNYPATIYYKGAVVVGMLRYELGDSIFFAALRDYLLRYAYDVATTEDLKSVLEEHAGRSLDWFFDQWVYGRGWPVIDVETETQRTSEGYNRVTITLKQVQSAEFGTYINLPVELTFMPPSTANPPVNRIARMTQAEQTFSFDSIPDYAALNLNRGPTLRTLMRTGTISGVSVGYALPDSGDISFVVKPNPTPGDTPFTVNVRNTGDCSGLQYELYNSTGERMLIGRNDACEFTIPVRGFPSGAYVLRFKLQNVYYDVPVVVAN